MASLLRNVPGQSVNECAAALPTIDSPTEMHKTGTNRVGMKCKTMADQSPDARSVSYYSYHETELSPVSAAHASLSPTLLSPAAPQHAITTLSPSSKAKLDETLSDQGAAIGERLLENMRNATTPLRRLVAQRQLVTLGGPYAVLGSGNPLSIWTRSPPFNPNVISEPTRHFAFLEHLQNRDPNVRTPTEESTIRHEGGQEASSESQARPLGACNLIYKTQPSPREDSETQKSLHCRQAYTLTPAECYAVSLLSMEYSDEDKDAHCVSLNTFSPPFTEQAGSSCLSHSGRGDHPRDSENNCKNTPHGSFDEFLSLYSDNHRLCAPDKKHVSRSTEPEKNCKKTLQRNSLGKKRTRPGSKLNEKLLVARKLQYDDFCNSEGSLPAILRR